MEAVASLLIGLVALAVGLGVGYVLRQRSTARVEDAARLGAEKLLAEATARQKEILLEAKDEVLQLRNAAEQEVKERRLEVQRAERRLESKEQAVDRRFTDLELKLDQLQQRDQEIQERLHEVERLRQEQVRELQRVASLSLEQAREIVLRKVEEEAREDSARLMRDIEQEARESAEAKAKQILSVAIQRYAGEQVAETTVSVVPIPNEEMKGRIIGREGRNIRALEAATGVDLIIDDTPDAVTLSSFDPIRREVARVALNKLVLDGRIHPGRIEEIVAKAKQEIEALIRQEGEAAAYEAGVHGLHPEIVKVMGRMKFRASYGQNQLQHSIEVAHIAAMLAADIGIDVAMTRRAGFLHDIGKVLTHEFEGPHHIVGGDFVRRYGESALVADAVSGHHDHDPEFQTPEAVVVQAADAISGARPGARRESVEHYVKRLEALENVANSFEGVEKSFAIQAGREVRIIVRPEEVDDLGASRLARDIVRRIEDSLQYPGQIKVTVVRETRAVDYAR
ncbi:MAG: ribonuclease Y [Chloroflexi bacterium]|nr:ribonuclease Y [Chloroflexota bacterium]